MADFSKSFSAAQASKANPRILLICVFALYRYLSASCKHLESLEQRKVRRFGTTGREIVTTIIINTCKNILIPSGTQSSNHPVLTGEC